MASISRRAKRIVFFGVILSAFLCVAAWAAFRCLTYFIDGSNDGPPSTDTMSRSLSGDAAKVAFLGRYLKLLSHVEAAEFHVVFHNNGFAPSDWSVNAVLKIEPADVSKWTEGSEPLDTGIDLSWGYNLLPLEPRWKVDSVPILYYRESCVLAVFERQGILFKSCNTT